MTRGLVVLLCIVVAVPAQAVTLDLPGNAVKTVSRDEGDSDIRLPSGAWNGERVPTIERRGQVRRTAWQLRGQMSTSAQVIGGLERKLVDAGWTVDFACADRECGGYDFRFASNTLPAPQMYVDLGNYRYLLATDPGGAAVSLMVSRGRDRVWVQLTEVVPPGSDTAATVTTGGSVPGDSDGIVASLDATGRAVLHGVRFASGSSQLREPDSEDLESVAAYLADNPSRTFAVVGHTDSDGGLEPNIALSRARAQAVRRALIDSHGVPAGQIEARGIGYLAPLARNDTPEGRLANRRVEIVATN